MHIHIHIHIHIFYYRCSAHNCSLLKPSEKANTPRSACAMSAFRAAALFWGGGLINPPRIICSSPRVRSGAVPPLSEIGGASGLILSVPGIVKKAIRACEIKK